jgi:hypothetical protein
VHGNLILELPNDTYFISPHGLLSFGTLNVAQQFAASSLDAVDPLIREYVTDAMASNINYRKCKAFQYKGGPFGGFKIGNNKVLISLFDVNLYAWSLFSGDFEQAGAFLMDLDQSLYLAIDHEVYEYGDKSPAVFGDQDGTAMIPFVWSLPVIHLKGKRFAGKRIEIQADYPSSFVLREENSLSLLLYGDLSKTFSAQNPYVLSLRGDKLHTLPLARTDHEEALGLRFDEPYTFPKIRLQFVSSRFSLSLQGYTLDGPVIFNKLRLFGVIERG